MKPWPAAQACAAGQDQDAPEARVLSDLGYFGHFLHVHAGGRSGKQHILTHLLLNGGSMSQQELLEHSGVSSGSLSEVLAKLEAEGLIERRRSPEDGRQRDAALTEAGRIKARQFERRKKGFETDSLAPLSEKERVQLAGLLGRVRAHWEAIEGAERAKPDPRPDPGRPPGSGSPPNGPATAKVSERHERRM